MHGIDPEVVSKGYRRSNITGQIASAVLVADALTSSPPSSSGVFVEFHPRITQQGDYDLYFYVPGSLDGGKAAIEVQHDTLNTTLTVDLIKSGWIKVNAAPLRMDAGALQNTIKIKGAGDGMHPPVVDSIKLVRVK